MYKYTDLAKTDQQTEREQNRKQGIDEKKECWREEP